MTKVAAQPIQLHSCEINYSSLVRLCACALARLCACALVCLRACALVRLCRPQHRYPLYILPCSRHMHWLMRSSRVRYILHCKPCASACAISYAALYTFCGLFLTIAAYQPYWYGDQRSAAVPYTPMKRLVYCTMHWLTRSSRVRYILHRKPCVSACAISYAALYTFCGLFLTIAAYQP